METREKLKEYGFKETISNTYERELNIPTLHIKEIIEIGTRRYLDSYYHIELISGVIKYTEDIDLIESRYRNLQKIFYEVLTN